MRHIVVGDVHGCAEELLELLKLVEFEPSKDDLGFVGDLVDRGPDSLGALRYVRDLCERGRAWSCKGNHDDKHVRYRRHLRAERETGKKNPMRLPEERRREHDAYSDEDIAFLAGLPLWREISPHLYVVHAGFLPGIPIADQDPDICMRVRYVYPEKMEMASLKAGDPGKPPGSVRWTTLWKGPAVIYGHAVYDLREPTVEGLEEGAPLTYGIDMGCCFGGHLTAAVWNDNLSRPIEFVQVKARGAYSRWMVTER